MRDPGNLRSVEIRLRGAERGSLAGSPTETTDAALVERVLAGDVAAFALLVDRYYEPCARFARRMLGNRDDAEDALQEALLRAYLALGRYRERDRFRAWLFRILVNQCRTFARGRARAARRFVHDDAAHAAASVTVEDGALRDALQMALEALEVPAREALLLKYGEGLEYDEMASITGASVSALKMRVKRAREAMRPRLEESDDDQPARI